MHFKVFNKVRERRAESPFQLLLACIYDRSVVLMCAGRTPSAMFVFVRAGRLLCRQPDGRPHRSPARSPFAKLTLFESSSVVGGVIIEYGEAVPAERCLQSGAHKVEPTGERTLCTPGQIVKK